MSGFWCIKSSLQIWVSCVATCQQEYTFTRHDKGWTVFENWHREATSDVRQCKGKKSWILSTDHRCIHNLTYLTVIKFVDGNNNYFKQVNSEHNRLHNIKVNPLVTFIFNFCIYQYTQNSVRWFANYQCKQYPKEQTSTNARWLPASCLLLVQNVHLLVIAANIGWHSVSHLKQIQLFHALPPHPVSLDPWGGLSPKVGHKFQTVRWQVTVRQPQHLAQVRYIHLRSGLAHWIPQLKTEKWQLPEQTQLTQRLLND